MNHRIMHRTGYAVRAPRPKAGEGDAIIESLHRAMQSMGAEQLLRELAGLIPQLLTLKETLGKTVEDAHAAVKEVRTIKKGDKGDAANEERIVARILANIKHMMPKAVRPSDRELVDLIMPHIPEPLPGPMPKVDYSAIAKMVLTQIAPPEKGDKGDAPAMDEIVQSLATHLIENKKLRVEHVFGLDDRLRSISNRPSGYIHGGGITRLTAGTNITITKLSDQSYRITASSSGISELAATESPNGSRTVFTFATASAQPSYLNIDNTLVKATSKAGTVNWTWSSGTKKATLVAIPAPNDEIFGIV